MPHPYRPHRPASLDPVNKSELPVGMVYHREWSERVAAEIYYRLTHGFGGARILNVARDAVLHAPEEGLENVPSPRGQNVMTLTLSCGPTLRRKIDGAVSCGWSRSGFCRSALGYYLDIPITMRPRNLPGSDIKHDPLAS